MTVEERWQRRFPLHALDLDGIRQLIGAEVLDAELLTGGLRNTNYKVRLLGAGQPMVLRLYTADADACAREVALMQLVHDRVPVPAVVRAERALTPPWALFEWLDGARFDRMLLSASPHEVEQSCRAAGAVLAGIHSFTFSSPGMLGPRLEVAQPMGFSWLTGVKDFFASGQARRLVGDDLAKGVVQVVERQAWRLDGVWSQAHLIHCDYKPWNLLVQRDPSGWYIKGVLDWEFSISGPPVYDVSIFLRYRDRMPPEYTHGLLSGYRDAGGNLPEDAAKLSRLIDLVSLSTFLERASDDPAIVVDIAPVLAATVSTFTS